MIIKLITGLAGGGKSTVLNAFEDLGYYCMDNLPPNLLKEFIALFEHREDTGNIALVMDLRLGSFFEDVQVVVEELRSLGYNIEILFVEASDSALKKRFALTRRTHPLETKGNVMKAIAEEREKLSNLREMSDRIIDTSSLNSHQLKKMIQELYAEKREGDFTINVVSFGVKHGDFVGADFSFDVRFLPNPFYEEKLQSLTGYDEAVREYIMKDEVSQKLFEAIINVLEIAVSEMQASGRNSATIAFGCTGGRHRSVTFAYLVHEHFKRLGYSVEQNDREIV
ncbi:RNase adapter RapZ [Guggenheimella bovis]